MQKTSRLALAALAFGVLALAAAVPASATDLAVPALSFTGGSPPTGYTVSNLYWGSGTVGGLGTVQWPYQQLWDGANKSTIKAASTAPLLTDTALVVTERDTVQVQSNSANLATDAHLTAFTSANHTDLVQLHTDLTGPIPAGSNTIGAVTQASGPWTVSWSGQTIGITGTLPAFASTPTVNLGTLNGAATAAGVATVNATLGSPFQAGGSIGNTSFGATGFAAISSASVTRPIGTPAAYTANTGWSNATASCTSASCYFSFLNVCRANGGDVLIPEIDIYSSANPTTRLTGVLFLFSAIPGTIINDAATFTIASSDYANLTGGVGTPFSLATNQASGAANSGVALAGAALNGPLHAQCASGSTTIYGMVQVTNLYTPASAEVLTVKLHTVGVN